jgi:hypothetical protein
MAQKWLSPTGYARSGFSRELLSPFPYLEETAVSGPGQVPGAYPFYQNRMHHFREISLGTFALSKSRTFAPKWRGSTPARFHPRLSPTDILECSPVPSVNLHTKSKPCPLWITCKLLYYTTTCIALCFQRVGAFFISQNKIGADYAHYA